MKYRLVIPPILFLFLAVFPQDPRSNPRYLLDISEAYNQLEKKNYGEAGTLVNNYLRSGERFADAYLIMGEILLARKHYFQAGKYFNDAEKGKNYFILPENVVRLCWNQVKAFGGSKKLSQLLSLNTDEVSQENIFDDSISLTKDRVRKIQKALQNLIDYASSRPGDFYRDQLGRAYFMLGRIELSIDPLNGIQNFLQSIERHFLVKSSYLYISYFFAIHNQQIINQVYQENSHKISQKPPQKRRAFLFYYQNYKDTQENEYLRRNLMPEPEYAAIKYATRQYYQSLQK